MYSKDYILSEVKRLASELGRPPGKQIFQKRTGIPEGQWYGNHWLSWKDVLIEAGLTPNEAPRKIEKDNLLQHYANAIRDFGRIPTSAELRILRKKNKDFPSETTFRKTFPTKNLLLNSLRIFINQNSDNSDLIEFLPSETELVEDTEDFSEGHVYLLRSGEFYKIGKSNQIEQRIKSISVKLPDASELIHMIRTDDPSGIEAYWHKRFADRRANGEWFKLSSSDVRAFRRRKFQ